MAEATVTFDPYRLRDAMVEEMDNHWRTPTGHCQCNRSVTKDPAKMKQHIADEMLAVILRFQGAQPEPEDRETPERRTLRERLSGFYPSLYRDWQALPERERQEAVIRVPRPWVKGAVQGSRGVVGTLFAQVPVVAADVDEPQLWVEPRHGVDTYL